MPIRELSTHPEAYVSVGDLASYWRVSRKYIYKLIDAGSLPAIQLGERLFRIPTEGAWAFETRSVLAPQREASSGRM